MSADNSSFVREWKHFPDVVLADAALFVPLWAVSMAGIASTYHAPPIGSTSARTVLGTHDDTLTLSGLLVGKTRFLWKQALEGMAESAARGSILGSIPGVGDHLSGLILISPMTIRTDVYVTSLSFTQAANRQDVIAVQLTLVHLPRPTGLSTLLDLGGAAASTVATLKGVW